MINDNEINYQDLEIDKSNSSVNYNDKLHKYWIKGNLLPCISVTTLIHKFTTFDEAFWSAYKTLEALIDEDTFKSVKGDLLKTKTFNYYLLEQLNIDKEVFEEKRQEILNEWEIKRETSCIRGSGIHRDRELEHLSGMTPEIQNLGLGGKFNLNVTNSLTLGEQGVYPEVLLSYISDDLEFRLAGQADLVIVDGHSIYVIDYKTNKEIKMKSYYDRNTKSSQMMKYPLNNLEDTNFWHYSLQLSTYAWMIEKNYPGVVINKLVIIHYDHEGNCTPYECEYLKNEVERMLDFYKRETEYNKLMESRKKISF